MYEIPDDIREKAQKVADGMFSPVDGNDVEDIARALLAERKSTTEICTKIMSEIYRAVEILDASQHDLLAIIGSYGDTISDGEVLDLLQEWNIGRPVLNHAN